MCAMNQGWLLSEITTLFFFKYQINYGIQLTCAIPGIRRID